MKLQGRRQSKNVEVQEPSERKETLNHNKLMRDIIGNTNERLKEKTPVAKIKPNINEKMNTINPGFAQEHGGYKMNNRTLRETAKPGHFSKKQDKPTKDAKFFLK